MDNVNAIYPAESDLRVDTYTTTQATITTEHHTVNHAGLVDAIVNNLGIPHDHILRATVRTITTSRIYRQTSR